MTLPGVPLIFAGDEVGARYEPYSDRTGVAWDDRAGLEEWYARLIEIRGELPALHGTDMTVLEAPDGVFAYRRGADGGGSVTVAINFAPSAVSMRLDVGESVPAHPVDLLGGAPVRVEDGSLVVEMAPESVVVVGDDP